MVIPIWDISGTRNMKMLLSLGKHYAWNPIGAFILTFNKTLWSKFLVEKWGFERKTPNTSWMVGRGIWTWAHFVLRVICSSTSDESRFMRGPKNKKLADVYSSENPPNSNLWRQNVDRLVARGWEDGGRGGDCPTCSGVPFSVMKCFGIK